MKFMMAVLAILMFTALPLGAQERSSTTAPAPEAMHADIQPHPAVSQDSSWAGAVIIIILGLFLAAAVIGPIVHANRPPEVPPAHSHDEPPGTSGHHGRSGQIDHNAPDEQDGHGHSH